VINPSLKQILISEPVPNPKPNMNTQTILKGILGAAIAGLLPAAATAQSTVTWQGPTTISAASDVFTGGTLFGTWAPYSGDASGGLTVNGVAFQATPTLPNASTSLDNGTGSGSFTAPNTGDANYNDLMTSGAFGNNAIPYTISWNGMTAGDTYAVQLWVNDGRNSTVNQRTETVTGGANTSAFLSYGSATGPGQYIIGTFVADISGGQMLTLNAGPAFPSAQLNLIQVRDVTPIPEPSTVAFSLIGFGLLARVMRRK
jgi:hypothetical protein